VEEIRLRKDRVRQALRKMSFTVKENVLERRDKAERIERKILSKESTDERNHWMPPTTRHPALKKGRKQAHKKGV